MDTNNLSTIATFLAICITGILAYFGYTVDQAQFTNECNHINNRSMVK